MLKHRILWSGPTITKDEELVKELQRSVEVLAQAFNYGAKDAFRKPYMCDLIVERVNAILEHLDHSKQWTNI